MYDLIIIGGGPAGISAAIYAARKKLNALLITKDFISQAGWATEVENYPGFLSISGLDLMAKFKEHLDKFKIDINEGEEVKAIEKKDGSFEVKTTEKDRFSAKAVLIASGRDPRPLEVPGEKEFIGKGVSYCVTCDGPLFQNKATAVIGGGNAGFGAAFELSKYCPKVYLLEASGSFKADERLQELVQKTNKVELALNAEVLEIKGSNFVEELLYQDKAAKQNKALSVSAVFVEIGSVPATGFLKGLVDFNEKDEIMINPRTGATKTPGLFAAGDVTDIKYKQIVIAAGEAAKAALSAYEYLKEIV